MKCRTRTKRLPASCTPPSPIVLYTTHARPFAGSHIARKGSWKRKRWKRSIWNRRDSIFDRIGLKYVLQSDITRLKSRTDTVQPSQFMDNLVSREDKLTQIFPSVSYRFRAWILLKIQYGHIHMWIKITDHTIHRIYGNVSPSFSSFSSKNLIVIDNGCRKSIV